MGIIRVSDIDTIEKCRVFVRNHMMASGLESRYRHTVAVASLMRSKALELGLDPVIAESLGLLHDIGYCNDYVDTGFHPLDGFNALKFNYPYFASQMLNHTSTPEEAAARGIQLPAVWEDSYSLLLTWADCRIDAKGRFVGFEGRLADILNRYGAGSVVGKSNTAAWERIGADERFQLFNAVATIE